ncbi:hypothetical protein D8674_011444 [Pyrus ussuriensis x Pyrus communis]|uniref:Retrotransposon Copia-like N-terminal domain-containing protein n=1 Tax=Pyrus ussuriensis x Pyrus communis TaxID=2448454 RepID=A0A5N5FYV6_9ROSA|nr:hypothetical protein D8674_011444 [Pyrus ussuriensis x Pyrus communis]
MASLSLKIEGLLGMPTIRLQDDNFANWSFQFRSILEGYDFFEGTNVWPPKYVISLEDGVTKEITNAYREWVKTDKALLSLLITILGDEAIEYVVGYKTAHEAWTSLIDRYATVSRARINHLKTELHTIKKGADTIEKYLLRLKGLKDQLLAAGEIVSDNDLIVVALAGLPSEYNMIKIGGLQFPMTGMYSYGESFNAAAQRGQGFPDGGFGFISQNQRHNGNGPPGGGFNQRFNSRPRFNGGNGQGNKDNINERNKWWRSVLHS